MHSERGQPLTSGCRSWCVRKGSKLRCGCWQKPGPEQSSLTLHFGSLWLAGRWETEWRAELGGAADLILAFAPRLGTYLRFDDESTRSRLRFVPVGQREQHVDEKQKKLLVNELMCRAI